MPLQSAVANRISKAASRGGNDPLYGAKTLIVISAPENTYHVEQLDVGIMPLLGSFTPPAAH